MVEYKEWSVQEVNNLAIEKLLKFGLGNMYNFPDSFSPANNIQDAFKVLEYVGDSYPRITFLRSSDKYRVELNLYTADEDEEAYKYQMVEHESLPMAICLAALETYGIIDPGESTLRGTKVRKAIVKQELQINYLQQMISVYEDDIQKYGFSQKIYETNYARGIKGPLDTLKFVLEEAESLLKLLKEGEN